MYFFSLVCMCFLFTWLHKKTNEPSTRVSVSNSNTKLSCCCVHFFTHHRQHEHQHNFLACMVRVTDLRYCIVFSEYGNDMYALLIIKTTTIPQTDYIENAHSLSSTTNACLHFFKHSSIQHPILYRPSELNLVKLHERSCVREYVALNNNNKQ